MITTTGRVGKPVWRAGHLVPAMDQAAALDAAAASPVVGTLCGALLVRPAGSSAIPCAYCAAVSRSARLWLRPPEAVPGKPATDPGGQLERLARWGWPVLRWGDETAVLLGVDLAAVLLPTAVASQAQEVLITNQERRAPVLVHPQHPEHRVLLAQERFGAELPWPPQALPVGGCLPAPPAHPHDGAPAWHYLPDDPRTFAREIDLWSALRTVAARTERAFFAVPNRWYVPERGQR